MLEAINLIATLLGLNGLILCIVSGLTIFVIYRKLFFVSYYED